eukprot:521540-Rhodomonas_salina.1
MTNLEQLVPLFARAGLQPPFVRQRKPGTESKTQEKKGRACKLPTKPKPPEPSTPEVEQEFTELSTLHPPPVHHVQTSSD